MLFPKTKMARTGQRIAQKGVNILQVLIGTVVGAIALVAAVNAVQGQRAEAQLNEAFAFIANEMSSALASYYYSNSRSYAGLTVGASGTITDGAFAPNAEGTTTGAQVLIDRLGLRNEMPWGGDIWEITADGTAAQIALSFGCTQIGGNAQVSTQRCEQLANAINNARSQQLTAADGTGNCAFDPDALTVGCTYRRPL